MTTPTHLFLSVPSGYHARELLLPLRELLTNDQDITRITCLCPAAAHRADLFPECGDKFTFVANPGTVSEHVKLLQELKPSLVITPTAGLDTFDTPILKAATMVDLPTLTFIASWDNIYKMERFRDFRKEYVLAQYFMVWNEQMFNHLLKIFPQIPRERIRIIGAPRLDYFSHVDRIPARATLLNELGFPDDSGPLLHVATTELYPSGYIVQTIREAVDQGLLPSTVHLFVSVHPGGDLRQHQDYAQKYGARVQYAFGRRGHTPRPEFRYTPTEREIYLSVALFKYTNVLVNHSSTVALEAMLCDVPVINVKYGQRFDWWRWRRSMVYRDFTEHYAQITRGGGTTIVKRKQELIDAINHYLQHPESKRSERKLTVQNLITTTNGTASQQFLDYIKEIALTAKR